MHIDWKGLLFPTKDSRHGNWIVLMIMFVTGRAIVLVWVGDRSEHTYLLIFLSSMLTLTYGALRLVELLNVPGFKVRYMVRSANVIFMIMILIGELFYHEMMGRALLVLALLAIEFNLVSMFIEYTGKDQWLRHQLRRLVTRKRW
ncbi:MAG: hypothetical protein HPY73_03380 [Methanomassiliicoccales archaeon]|nr:MAG: hypothetical protein HPY73_03380 [Methanomassiliicoccales archaeon]